MQGFALANGKSLIGVSALDALTRFAMQKQLLGIWEKHQKMVLFITVYVSFLFSLFGQWSLHVLELRILDTAMGGALAVAGAFLVRPKRVSPA